MTIVPWLWIPLTIFAALTQTVLLGAWLLVRTPSVVLGLLRE